MSTPFGTRSTSQLLSEVGYTTCRDVILQDPSQFSARLQSALAYEIDPEAGKAWLNRVRIRSRRRKIIKAGRVGLRRVMGT
jgi:hypothetical protein